MDMMKHTAERMHVPELLKVTKVNRALKLCKKKKIKSSFWQSS
jgi:hypothetical protein